MKKFLALLILPLVVGCTANRIGTAVPAVGAPAGPVFFPDLSSNKIVADFPDPIGGPNYIAEGSDGNLWLTLPFASDIQKLTLSGLFTTYPIPSGHAAGQIAPGRRGTLWFLEQSAVGSISTSTGSIAEFALPFGSSVGPWDDIVKGSDGNMWFTDDGDNSVDKITTAGTFTRYAIPTANAHPQGIAAGPDGNLWFTEWGAEPGTVGRITTAGVVTEYPFPGSVFRGLFWICAGPDGNMYVSEWSRNAIAQVTMAGIINEYPIGFKHFSFPTIVALGSDKLIWITNQANSRAVAAFDPKTLKGVLSLHGPTSFATLGETIGADGDMWFAGTGGNDVWSYEEKITNVGIRLNGEMSIVDPNYGFELGYAVGTGTQTQTISLPAGETVRFRNLDTIPHSAAFLGDATLNSAPWPPTFDGSTTQSPAGTAVGTSGWATGSLNPTVASPLYETGMPGFYMIGCQYHYNTNEMRTVIIVH